MFIDINAPPEHEAEALDKQWLQDIKRWMDRLPTPTPEEPDSYNALYVTNFAPHYQGDELAGGGEWASVKPLHVRNPLGVNLTAMLDHALENYHRAPNVESEDTILE